MSEPQSNVPLLCAASDAPNSARFVGPESTCPYLPNRRSRSEAYHVEFLDGGTYRRLLALGFRRSGRVVYRPRCQACAECRQLRVPVGSFRPTRSMRRVLRRNGDVVVTVEAPVPTLEKHRLFQNYLDAHHDHTMSRDYETFVDFLYDSPMESAEITYWVDRRLLGVSIADVCEDGLSSVYMYFDPGFAWRSPGTLSILREIEHCRVLNLPYYYLGFYVAGSETMSYKARFRPHELLDRGNHWVKSQDSGANGPRDAGGNEPDRP